MKFKYYVSLLGVIAGNVIILVEILLSITGGRLAFFLATFCSPFFFLLFAMLFARDLTKKNAILNHLYDRLKEDEPAISETTQAYAQTSPPPAPPLPWGEGG